MAVGSGSGHDVPEGVAAEHLPVRRITDFIDDTGCEAVESCEVLVAFGQGPDSDEECSEVIDGEPVSFGVEQFVAELGVLTSKACEQGEAFGAVPVAQDRPGPAGGDQDVHEYI